MCKSGFSGWSLKLSACGPKRCQCKWRRPETNKPVRQIAETFAASKSTWRVHRHQKPRSIREDIQSWWSLNSLPGSWILWRRKEGTSVTKSTIKRRLQETKYPEFTTRYKSLVELRSRKAWFIFARKRCSLLEQDVGGKETMKVYKDVGKKNYGVRNERLRIWSITHHPSNMVEAALWHGHVWLLMELVQWCLLMTCQLIEIAEGILIHKGPNQTKGPKAKMPENWKNDALLCRWMMTENKVHVVMRPHLISTLLIWIYKELIIKQ